MFKITLLLLFLLATCSQFCQVASPSPLCISSDEVVCKDIISVLTNTSTIIIVFITIIRRRSKQQHHHQQEEQEEREEQEEQEEQEELT